MKQNFALKFPLYPAKNIYKTTDFRIQKVPEVEKTLPEVMLMTASYR